MSLNWGANLDDLKKIAADARHANKEKAMQKVTSMIREAAGRGHDGLIIPIPKEFTMSEAEPRFEQVYKGIIKADTLHSVINKYTGEVIMVDSLHFSWSEE